MLHRLPGRINRLLYAWASSGSLESFCRRFNRLNALRWKYPIRIEPVGEPGTTGRMIKITDDEGRFMHIGRRTRVPLYINGISARRRQILDEYLLGELTFTEDDLVVDVGANVGDLTTAIQEKVPVHAICVEPEQLECIALQLNVLPNRTRVQNSLLYSDARDVTFFSANDRGDSSLFEPKQHTGSCVRRTTTLDAAVGRDPLFLARGRIRLLKLEAEGAEPEILAGATEVLPCCDYITADLGPERGAQQETTLIPVIETLARYGFKPIRFGLPRCVMLFERT